MKHINKKMKNTLLNAMLVVLLLLLLVLMLLTWGNVLQQAGWNGMWSSSVAWFGDGGYVKRAGDAPAVYPTSIAMTDANGTLTGVVYSESTIGSCYEEVSPLLADALQQVDQFIPTSESTLCSALREDTVMMQYSTAVPMQLIRGWLSVQNAADLPDTAEMLLLTRSGELFVRSDSQTGALYMAQVSVDDTNWAEICQNAMGTAVQYAGLYPTDAYNGLYAESLIADTRAQYDILQVEIPDFSDPEDASNLQTLLEAFGYSAYAQYDMGEDGETQIFVENYSTLEISPTGKIQFQATAMTGGLSSYSKSDADSIDPLIVQVDFSQELLTSVLRAIGSTAGTMLQAVQTAADDTCVLQFSQVVNGIPLQTTDNQRFAQFKFQNGVLIAAELWLRTYAPSGEKLYIMPEKQAAASIQDGVLHQYQIAYLETDAGERVLPTACLQ